MEKNLNEAEILQLFLSKPRNKYTKSSTFRINRAEAGQRITTIIDGQKETENVAGANDSIVTGPAGEQYIISAETLKKRYDHIDGDLYKAKGIIWGNVYQGTRPVSFLAPWGADMILCPGDILASTSENGDNGDIYRIEKSVFHKTYQKY